MTAKLSLASLSLVGSRPITAAAIPPSCTERKFKIETEVMGIAKT